MERVVKDEIDRKLLITFIQNHKLPFVATIVKGKPRTVKQNRLQRLWINEIAEQLGDRSPEEVRGEIKLRFGVPLLRAENEKFREKYDAVVKPLPYASKLDLMMEPIDFPISRLMTTAQYSKFLDEVHRFYSGQGLKLTDPPND